MRTSAANATPAAVTEGLLREGYVIVEGILAAGALARARGDLAQVLAETPTGRNDFEGFATKRVYALFAKTRAFDDAAVHPLALGVLDRVLGHYQLRPPVGIRIGPGEKAQVLHRRLSGTSTDRIRAKCSRSRNDAGSATRAMDPQQPLRISPPC